MQNRRRNSPVEHGFPHLATVRAALTALHRRLPRDGIQAYAAGLAPADAAFTDSDDLYLGAQRVAAAVVRQLRLPDARMVIAYRAMEEAAAVELAAGPEYFIEVNDRFRTHRRDLAAALAHEVTHVLLHRLGLRFPGTGADGTPADEILTDTAAAYLGAGWLLLDAYREDALGHQKLGYLTPEEFGYVLAKRAAFFGPAADPAVLFTSPQAYEAYVRGAGLARRDRQRPPLAAAGPVARRRYARARRAAAGAAASPAGAPYRFEGAGAELRVSFPCPVCEQRVRVPVRGRLRARCALCGTVLDCDT